MNPKNLVGNLAACKLDGDALYANSLLRREKINRKVKTTKNLANSIAASIRLSSVSGLLM